jgi:hypothetical protein
MYSLKNALSRVLKKNAHPAQPPRAASCSRKNIKKGGEHTATHTRDSGSLSLLQVISIAARQWRGGSPRGRSAVGAGPAWRAP